MSNLRSSLTMRRLGLVALFATTLALAACGSEGIPAEQLGSSAKFAQVASANLEFDYDPLTPKQVVEIADLVVLGEVVGLREGLSASVSVEASQPLTAAELADVNQDLPEGDKISEEDLLEAGREVRLQTTRLRLEVREVLSGDKSVEGTIIEVDVYRAPTTNFETIKATEFRGEALFILEENSGWDPGPGYEFKNRPDGPLWIPFSDGAWFTDTDGSAIGVFASTEDLADEWNKPETVSHIADAIRGAR